MSTAHSIVKIANPLCNGAFDLSPDHVAIAPVRPNEPFFNLAAGTPQSAADIKASQSVVCPPQSVTAIPTNIAIACPASIYAVVYPRSGMFLKQSIYSEGIADPKMFPLSLPNTPFCGFRGVIDSDYRGELIVLMYNGSANDVPINQGEAVAQIVFHPRPLINFRTYESQSILRSQFPTLRDTNGFGSTSQAPPTATIPVNQSVPR